MCKTLLALACAVTALHATLAPATAIEKIEKVDKFAPKSGGGQPVTYYPQPAQASFFTLWELVTLVMGLIGVVLSMFALAEAKTAQRTADEACKIAEEAKAMAKEKK